MDTRTLDKLNEDQTLARREDLTLPLPGLVALTTEETFEVSGGCLRCGAMSFIPAASLA